MFGRLLLGREEMYFLAALFEPPTQGLAALLAVGFDGGNGWFGKLPDSFPRPGELQRCWYREQADKFLEKFLFVQPAMKQG